MVHYMPGFFHYVAMQAKKLEENRKLQSCCLGVEPNRVKTVMALMSRAKRIFKDGMPCT